MLNNIYCNIYSTIDKTSNNNNNNIDDNNMIYIFAVAHILCLMNAE